MAGKSIEDDLGQLREDLAVLAKDVKNLASQQVSAEQAAMKERLEAVRVKGKEAMAKAGEGIDAVEDQIVKHPFSSILVAFGAGLILGRLLDR
jgi:ElaB/YqjD/DUF883 family membrane-anchored ribosome-binding protein